MGKVFFEKVLPWIIVKPRHFWIIVLGSLAFCSAFVVFYYPGLRLPDSQDFQLFDRTHPFEQYDLNYKYLFWFERNLKLDIVNRLPIRIVWGIQPIDNGYYLDPESKGTLEFDETFDISAPESQLWMFNFCRSLRNQSFYMSTLGPLLPNCFIETFKISMERRCVDPLNGFNRYPCCENSSFPFPRDVFDQCIHQGISELYQTPREFFIPGVAGPKFSKTTGKIKAVVVEYDSTYIWSLSYDQMHRFYTEVNTWVENQMKAAPKGLQNGWFTSYLSFYDVQRSLSLGTGMAVSVAVSVCLAVLLLTTLNFIVSLLAIISVAAVMVVTLAALVLLGWRLNVLESVTVSVAIGLAVDLTLHYGVAYRLAPEPERNAAVVWAAARLGSPVFMAALTSVGAGVAMLPARVLAYVHVGTFLTILTTVSYMYATFFYLPLLRILGPQRGFGQFSYPSCKYLKRCFRGGKDARVDKTVYQQAFISESTLSTSSNCGPNATSTASTVPTNATGSSDTHELEPLTCRKSSSRKRHPSISRLSSGAGVQSLDDPQIHHAHHHTQVNGGAGGARGSCVRSGSLSSTLSAKEKRERALRKVSLPSPTGGEGEQAEPSPKHAVGPTLSATTILYSEPDSSESGYHALNQAHSKPPSSPSYTQQSAPVQLVSPKHQDSCSSPGSIDADSVIA
ncbi:Protein dispatched-like protein 1 [Armadillidium nasatum]|uniref:Protein dispatched-like protein 1 n=1 Tax=Armadillidium nasatum TaxID=96803 RepID=A0A5N5SSY5_9CRUS|nr:Protein dispatched-like protein 1 [Armadillidium nasatum]